MPGGRINTNDRLQPWKADPTRPMLPPEPNYFKETERYREKVKAKNAAKKEKKKEEKIKRIGRGESNFVINDLNFVIKYGTYKGKQFGYVLKQDPGWIRDLVKNKDYKISETVMKELLKRRVIKG